MRVDFAFKRGHFLGHLASLGTCGNYILQCLTIRPIDDWSRIHSGASSWTYCACATKIFEIIKIQTLAKYIYINIYTHIYYYIVYESYIYFRNTWHNVLDNLSNITNILNLRTPYTKLLFYVSGLRVSKSKNNLYLRVRIFVERPNIRRKQILRSVYWKFYRRVSAETENRICQWSRWQIANGIYRFSIFASTLLKTQA